MVNVGENRARNGVTDSPKSRNEGKFQSMELLDLSRYATERLRTLRVNPSVFEFQEEEENDVVKEIEMIGAGSDGITRELQFPAVFIGGRMFGGLDQVMATHISGELIPVLKQAGALWL
ncbi:hypothetical protein E3N88_14827 [Mikania micrantha]|uniref:Uncharacterized protein n=1 Tax=Mikania micrantha TaxID=192012 RepID=A0A5N6P3U5_9ASTR|nr:hypothetical protein E3N88_14827 [Mikania micrantha]